MTLPFGCLKRCCFAWTVEKPFQGRSRKSPDFTYESKKFHLELDLDGSTYSLSMTSEEERAVPRHVVVQVENYNSGYLTPLSGCSLKYNNVSGRNQFIWRCDESSILRECPAFNSEGIFRLVVSFIDGPVELAKPDPSTGFPEDKSVQTSGYMNPLPCLERFSEDLSKLLDRGPEPDMVLISGDLNVKVHRSILSNRSEVFAAMLNSDMAEKRTSTVVISDMDQALFDHFVRYLYSGKLPDLTVDIAKGFYEAADKYAIKCLMERCASFLKDNLDLDNVYEMLILADAHSDADFKQKTIEYILQKEMHLQQDDRWLTFCKTQGMLANEVLNIFCKQLQKLKPAQQ